MIKEHFSLSKGERYGLFFVIACTLCYAVYIKYSHISYQPETVELKLLQDSVESYYASQPKPTYTSYPKEYKKKEPYISKGTHKKQKPETPKTKEVICIELNGASKEELKRIVGVGDFFAKSIIEEREKLGGYSSKEQLKNIYGMTAEKLKTILPQISINKTLIQAPILINSTDTTQLATIYDISEGCAKRIINYRNRLGGFYCLSQLHEVYGLDSVKYSNASHRIKLDTINTHTLDINNTPFKELMKHPYINGYENTKAIFRYLEYGPITTWEQFIKIPKLNIDQPERLKNYIVFNKKEESLE